MDETTPPSVPRRGEIWQVDWSPGRGSEQSGRRPALIVQNDAGNRSTRFPNTIVVAVSTKGRDIPFHVRLEPSHKNGLSEVSYVKCEQVLTISKDRLQGWDGSYLGKPLPEDVYVCQVKLLGADGKWYNYNQAVTLVR